jgi:hypothetical protein
MTKQGKAIDSLMDENKRLTEINSELIAACEAALEAYARYIHDTSKIVFEPGDVFDKLSALITKAKAKQ